ncbi:3884_t:CDS:2 [Funneliformis geosporum]|uniref:3884_t:CDS:1 n=1 Tax=Funneliformis geosporum TaxID=1117311 RepID=A0A9W4STZ2_9GLOM|nr:3884_t:CDS:2 [Funneliformis geosporum]
MSNSLNEAILASAFTSLLGTQVITQFDKNLNYYNNYQTVNIFSLYNSQLVGSLHNNDHPSFKCETGNSSSQFNIRSSSMRCPRTYTLRYAPYIPPATRMNNLQSISVQTPQQSQIPQPQISQIQQIQPQISQTQQIPQISQIQQTQPQISQIQQIQTQISQTQQIQSQIHQIPQVKQIRTQTPQIQQISKQLQHRFSQQSPVINIYVNTISGQIITITDVPIITPISVIKCHIENKTGIPRNKQQLTYLGVHLEDNTLLQDYQILVKNVIIYLIGDNGNVINFIDSNFLDPAYDYDFTNIKDDKQFLRGSHLYRRPCGWKRIAIRVLNKYGADNSWLGQVKNNSWRYESDPSEWPVSYHGTNRFNAKSIAETGFDIRKGKRFMFGYGIYSTPDINVAYLFASRFIHKNEVYCIVFQNRVNPRTLKKITTQYGEYWISPNSDDIRPYGICIKKLVNIRN